MGNPPRIDTADAVLGLAVFAITFVALMATMGIGVPRDESFYYHAAVQYVGWFNELWRNLEAGQLAASFTQASVDRHMSYNPEHPALMKMLFGLSWQLFSQKLGWLSEIEALRAPAVAFASALSSFVYLFGRAVGGRAVGLLSVALLMLQPRFFWHAHLACFDIPVIACWVAVVYGYWRSLERPAWAWFTGIAWGVGLSVKLNAFFLPGVLGLHWLVTAALAYRRGERIAFPWVFVAMAVFGPLLFFGLWPRHWFDTIDRVQWYLNFHLKHVHYFVYYFGENIQQPPLPISYPWVMTLVTVPATILFAFGIGVALYRRHVRPPDPLATGVLFAINILFPIALISMPDTPIFGGTKHWAAAMPFLAVFAAYGAVTTGRALGLAALPRLPASSAFVRAAGVTLVAGAVAAPALVGSVENHPLGPAYYNELIGSYRGAADLRMVRKFWGYVAHEGLPWLNEHAPERARVWTHNTTHYAWQMYQRDGLARQDLRPTGAEASDYALFHHQKAFIYMLIPMWNAYDTRTPAHVIERDGVPYLSIYERPRPVTPADAR